jgi:hypothetical protein
MNNLILTKQVKKYLCVCVCVCFPPLCGESDLTFYVGNCFSSLEIIYEGSFYISDSTTNARM